MSDLYNCPIYHIPTFAAKSEKMNVISLRHMFAATSIMLLTSCGNAETEQPANAAAPEAPAAAPMATTKDLEWLNGWWQKATPEGTVYERWTINGETLSGEGGFIKGKDTMVSETIVLQQQGTDLMYIPTVKGQNNDQPVPFKLTSATADSFVFENPEHDFPSKITYRKVSETTLVARISGKINGQEQAEAFELSKAQ